MKYLRPILTGLCATGLIASAAMADVTVRITGSTAFRTATMTAIENLMGGAGNFKAAYEAASSSTNGELSAAHSIFQGTVSGVSGTTTIVCSWAGSTGGVKTVAQNVTLTTWMSAANLPGTNTIVNVASPTYDAATIADITMSDSKQSSTKYTSPTLSGGKVGVVPFVWMKNAGAPVSLTNITSLQIRALLSGPVPLSQLTGNSADTTFVLAVGRDQDSGTRVAALSDSGYGSLTPPQQFRINASGSAVASAEFYPATTLLGETFPLGTAGYAGGSGVVSALNLTGSSTAPVYVQATDSSPAFTGFYAIGYAGTSDAKSLTGHSQDSTTGVFSSTGDLQILSYNGVPYSYANVREGKYTFWTYEWLLYRSSAATDVKSVATKLTTEISTNTAQISGIKLSTMNCSRTVEGGVVSHN